MGLDADRIHALEEEVEKLRDIIDRAIGELQDPGPAEEKEGGTGWAFDGASRAYPILKEVHRD